MKKSILFILLSVNLLFGLENYYSLIDLNFIKTNNMTNIQLDNNKILKFQDYRNIGKKDLVQFSINTPKIENRDNLIKHSVENCEILLDKIINKNIILVFSYNKSMNGENWSEYFQVEFKNLDEYSCESYVFTGGMKKN